MKNKAKFSTSLTFTEREKKQIEELQDYDSSLTIINIFREGLESLSGQLKRIAQKKPE